MPANGRADWLEDARGRHQRRLHWTGVVDRPSSNRKDFTARGDHHHCQVSIIRCSPQHGQDLQGRSAVTTSTQVIGLNVIRSDMLCHGERIQARAQPRRRILRVGHSDTGVVSEPFNDTTARQFCRRKRVRTLVKGQKIHGSVANLPQNRVIECPEGDSDTRIVPFLHTFRVHAVTVPLYRSLSPLHHEKPMGAERFGQVDAVAR